VGTAVKIAKSLTYLLLVKVSRDRPRWPKGFRVV